MNKDEIVQKVTFVARSKQGVVNIDVQEMTKVFYSLGLIIHCNKGIEENVCSQNESKMA